MGEPAHLSDSLTRKTANAIVFQSSYKANKKDTAKDKRGALYFLLEQYTEISAAQQKYSSTKKANEHHGIRTLDNLGDEAYFHADGENFYFIIVRKDDRVLSMKVNKITNTTSLDQFNAVAREITNNL